MYITTIDNHVQAKTQAIRRKELEQLTGGKKKHSSLGDHFLKTQSCTESFQYITFVISFVFNPSTTLDITRWSSRTVRLEPGHNGVLGPKTPTQHTESFLCVGGDCTCTVDQLLTLADELESIELELEELESELGKTLFLESSYVAIENQS